MPYPEPERREHAPPGCERLLAGLTPEQVQAVMHGTGPLLLIAGPGAGKTRILIHRIAHLLTQGGEGMRHPEPEQSVGLGVVATRYVLRAGCCARGDHEPQPQRAVSTGSVSDSRTSVSGSSIDPPSTFPVRSLASHERVTDPFATGPVLAWRSRSLVVPDGGSRRAGRRPHHLPRS